MKKTLSIIAASFAVTAAAMLATPARAEAGAVHYSVTTADLDLRTAAGQRALDHRLAIAVVEVCGRPSDADLAGKNDARACRAETAARLKAERDRRIAGAADAADPIRLAAR